MGEICIYKFTNNLNGKVYVGKTTSFTNRIKKHYRRFLSKEQSELALYKALEKYGWDNFSIEKIEECPEENLNDRECYWINYYDSYHNGYNETLGGDGGTLYDYKEIVSLWEQGKNMTEIQAILECSKGVVQRALDAYGIKNRKTRMSNPVEQYTLEGKFIQEFSSMGEAARKLGIPCISGISACCKKQQQSAGGFMWVFKGEEPPVYTVDRHKLRTNSPQLKRVNQYTKDGVLVRKYFSIAEASKTTGIDSSSISKCCRGKLKSTGGFMWKYE